MGVGGRSPLPTPRARIVPLLVAAAMAAGACTTPPARPGPSSGASPTVGPTATPASPAPAVLRLATTEPGSLDPRELDAPDDLQLASQLFDGLVAYDPETQGVVPAAAREWDVRDGGRRIVFRLRPGARFHDGTPVRADDFVFAWNRLADPLASAPYAFLLEDVAGFQRYQRTVAARGIPGLSAPNPRTLEVRLGQPWPGFVAVLGHPALSPVPPSAEEADFGAHPIGNGPYRLPEPLTPGGPILMDRFPGYAGPPPAVEQLVFRVFDEPEEAWPSFLAGDLDHSPIPASALADARSRFGSAGIVTLARLLYCGLNQLDPDLRSRRLGVAISAAVDREAIASRVYGDLAVPATGIVPPTIPGTEPDTCGIRCSRDLDRAAELVDELPRRSRSFALEYTASSVGDTLAEMVATQLDEVGLTVRAREHEPEEYQALLEQEREELFCLVWSADYPRQQAMLEPLLLSGSPENVAGISDPALDRLLEQARGEASPPARAELYVRAERMALARMPLVPLVWFRSHLAVQPNVEGFTVDPLGLFDASRLRLRA